MEQLASGTLPSHALLPPPPPCASPSLCNSFRVRRREAAEVSQARDLAHVGQRRSSSTRASQRDLCVCKKRDRGGDVRCVVAARRSNERPAFNQDLALAFAPRAGFRCCLSPAKAVAVSFSCTIVNREDETDDPLAHAKKPCLPIPRSSSSSFSSLPRFSLFFQRPSSLPLPSSFLQAPFPPPSSCSSP